MNKIKIAILGSFMVAGLYSCDKELNQLPETAVAEEVTLANDANIKKALNGAYDAISSGYALGGDMQMFSELLASNGELRWEGTYNQPREVFNKKILTTNSYVRDIWLSGYDVVNICNNILSAIDKVNTADQNKVKGEALFLRSVAFFELVKLYAKPYSAGNAGSLPGIPLVLEPTRGITDKSYVSRASLDATYNQIITDLTEAENLLPKTNGIYAEKAAAAAYLSRAYLQKADYAGARDAANRAIGYGTSSVVTPYENAFNVSGSSPESIWELIVTEQDGANDMQVFWSITMFGAREGDVTVLPIHFTHYPAGDDRLNLFYEGVGNTLGSGGWRVGKWRELYRNVGIVRMSEMYLTRAEANFRLGQSTGATPLADVNYIRTRHGGLPAYASVDLNTILNERLIELAFEGQGIADAKRLKKTIDGFAFDANELVLPIPQREVDANKNLAQNPGYN